MEVVIAISVTLNVVLVLSWLMRSEDTTLLRKALKAIADLGTDTEQGTFIDRGEVARMAVQALAGNERSVLQRLKDWRERRQLAKSLSRKTKTSDGETPMPSPSLPGSGSAPDTNSGGTGSLGSSFGSTYSAAPSPRIGPDTSGNE